MSPIAITIICSVLGSAGLFSFITFLIKRHDARSSEIEELKDEIREEFSKQQDAMQELNDQIKRSERDSVRTQLLVLMADYSDDTSELMHCAEHYFKDLEGNWYATPLFVKFLREKGIAAPEWLLS